jgi:hypothetical protein
MPIPLEAIQVVEDEIQRLNHPTPSEQDFSFLNKSLPKKRSVHYDIELLDDYEQETSKNQSPSNDQALRRRYIAHWSLPGNRITSPSFIHNFHRMAW